MLARRTLAFAAAGLTAGLLGGCGGDAGPGDARTAVATTTQVADLTRAVAGERAEVRQILRPNSDPHDYEPRPSDVEAVAGAAVVLRSGGGLDDWLGEVLDNAGSQAKATTLIDAVRRHGGERAIDPHWWQDPRNAIAVVQRIRDVLVAADPGGRVEYRLNAAVYVARLRGLDGLIARCMRSIPADRRRLVTDHDALGPYAERYDIEVVGTVIPGRTTQAQASAGEVVRLARTIRSTRVRTIFPQGSGNAKLVRAVAREAGVSVGPALYADTLGPAGSAGATYTESLRFNTRALARGFGARTGAGSVCQL